MFISRKYRLIIILSLLLITAFLSVSFFNYRTATTSIRTEIVNSSLPLLRENIYSEIQKILTPPINIASLMANDSFLKNWALEGETDEREIFQFLNGIRQKYGYFSAFFVSANTGKYYHYDGVLKTISPQDDHDVWYYNFVATGKTYELDVDSDQASNNKLTMFINFRLEDFSGNLLGVTGVGLEMENFSGFLSEKQKKYDRRIYLTDRSGVVQAHPDTSLIESANINTTPGIKKEARLLLSAKDDPVDSVYDTEHGRVLVTSRYVPEIDWFLLVEQDEDSAMADPRHTLWRTLLMGLVTSLVIITLTTLTINSYQKRLERMAVTDELTQANNRREFESRFITAVSRFGRYKTPITLVIVDIDHFKNINDSVGHLTGDKVLISITRIIKESVRPSDLVARWGGDEFVLLLECGIEEAYNTAERLRQRVLDKFPKEIELEGKAVSISMGLAEYAPDDTVETLTIKADKALYLSKNKGRNRVTVYSENTAD